MLSQEQETDAGPIDHLLLQHEIEQFYYKEAHLLDNRKFEEWFSLLDDEVHYYMPIRTNRIQREQKLEYGKLGDYAHFDDDIIMMRGRLRKLKSDVSWSENPASRTRHIVGNVIIESVHGGSAYAVNTAFIVYRNRIERQVDIFAGERHDLIRRAHNDLGFMILKRTILLDQSTILSNNLSFFF